MAISNTIPKVYSAIAERLLFRTPGLRDIALDLSAEASFGDNIYIPDYETTLAFTDVTIGTAITKTVPSDAQATLAIDKSKGLNVHIHDIDVRRARANIVQSFAEQTARSAAKQLDADIRAAIVAKTPSASSPDTRFVAEESQTNWVAAAGRATLWDALVAAADALFVAEWPTDNLFLLAHPKFRGRILRYVTIDKPNLGAGGIVDQAFINGDIGGRLLGFKTYWDATIADTLGAGSGATNIYFGIAQDTIRFAMQFQGTELQRVQGETSTAFLTTMQYGVVLPKDYKIGRLALSTS